jgi:hypothetical protein
VNATVLDLLKDKYAVRPRTTDLVFHSHAHTTLDGDGFPGQSMPLKRTRSGWGVVQNFDGVAVEKLIVQCLAQRKVFLSRKLFRPRLHAVLLRGTRSAERISLYLR